MPTIQLPDGSEREATVLDFEPTAEEWNEYELSDGTTLKVKLNLQNVLRVEGQYSNFGEPVYIINSENNVRSADVPEELMRDDTVDSSEVTDQTDPDRGVH